MHDERGTALLLHMCRMSVSAVRLDVHGYTLGKKIYGFFFSAGRYKSDLWCQRQRRNKEIIKCRRKANPPGGLNHFEEGGGQPEDRRDIK